MNYSVRKIPGDDGRTRDVVLLDPTGIPMYWPNLFTTSEYRNRGRSPCTMEAVLRTIAMLYAWGRYRGIDVDGRLTVGAFFTDREVADLGYFLRLKRTAQLKLELQVGVHASRPPKRINVNTVRMSIASSDGVRQACPALEAATRIRWVVKYLEFHRNRRSDVHEGAQQASKAHQSVCRVIERLRELIPRASGPFWDENLKGLSDEEMELIGAALAPESPNNPFESEFCRARNHLMWCLLDDCGMRAGELRDLLVSDVASGTRRVRIRYSKTVPRINVISRKTVEAFRDYTIQHRSKIALRKTGHGFLFVDANGDHLTSQAICVMFETIRSKVQGAPKNLTCTSLRRTWNDRYLRRLDALSSGEAWPEEKARSVQNAMMGWSPRSQMGQRYGRGQIQKKADEMAELLVSSIGQKS